MNSSAFTIAVTPIIKQFKTTSTEASYLSTLPYLPWLETGCQQLTRKAASLQVLSMGFGALVWMPVSKYSFQLSHLPASFPGRSCENFKSVFCEVSKWAPDDAKHPRLFSTVCCVAPLQDTFHKVFKGGSLELGNYILTRNR